MPKSSRTCASHVLLQAGVDNKDSHPIAAKAFKWIFYMDDFAKSGATVKKATPVYKDVRTTSKLGGFNLMKWICHNELDIGNVPDEDQSEANNKTFKASLTLHQFWACNGMWKMTLWKVIAVLKKKYPIRSHNEQCFFVAVVFDHLGLFAPSTMRMRILLRTI